MSLQIVRLRCEHLENPLGIDTATPRLSWQLRAHRSGTEQGRYRILAASSEDALLAGNPDVWDSGTVDSDDSVLVPWVGPEVRHRQRVYWTVRVWDDLGDEATAAPIAWFERGLDPSDWSARWISDSEPPVDEAVRYFGTEFVLDEPVVRGRAYATALGCYELRLNGAKVTDARLTPGWTDYSKRLQYQIFDISDLLIQGANSIQAVLADGWYSGYVGFVGDREHYGETPQLLVQIEIETPSRTIIIATDDSWRVGTGPIVASDMLRGEVQDLRLTCELKRAATVATGTRAVLVTSPAPPVRATEELMPITIRSTGERTHIVDFGQNFVGGVRLRLDRPEGPELTVRHAEVLDDAGSLYVDNLRTATSVDRYVLAGTGVELCEPIFTFHGFRYAEVHGTDELHPSEVTGVVIGSDVEAVGTFACSDNRVNRLHANIAWGARSNFVDVPTDCPQRDERLGWTGDAQVFVETACFQFDMAAFYVKWLRDLVDAQSADGGFPDVAPRCVDPADGAAGWADAGTIVPWACFERYGDRRLLAAAYPAMRRWVDYVRDANPNLLWLNRRNNDMGDWLNVGVETDKDLIATAFFAHSARTTARAAAALGYRDDAAEFAKLADSIAASFASAYVLDDGRLKSSTQTAYALALRFELVPDHLFASAVEHLVADVEAHGHLTTGFLGVNHLLPALSLGGRHDVAYRLLCHDGYPSWLYSVKHGATTIWERWDGWTTESGFQDPAMNSFNHYAFGAVGEWLYRTAAGIDLGSYGSRAVVIAPQPDHRVDWVVASYTSPRGPIGSQWHREEGGSIRVVVDIPVGLTATIRLPGIDTAIEVGSGRHEFRSKAEEQR